MEQANKDHYQGPNQAVALVNCNLVRSYPALSLQTPDPKSFTSSAPAYICSRKYRFRRSVENFFDVSCATKEHVTTVQEKPADQRKKREFDSESGLRLAKFRMFRKKQSFACFGIETQRPRRSSTRSHREPEGKQLTVVLKSWSMHRDKLKKLKAVDLRRAVYLTQAQIPPQPGCLKDRELESD